MIVVICLVLWAMDALHTDGKWCQAAGGLPTLDERCPRPSPPAPPPRVVPPDPATAPRFGTDFGGVRYTPTLTDRALHQWAHPYPVAASGAQR